MEQIRQLPMAQCGEVVKAADDAYRLHARRVRDEKTSTKTSGRLGFGASATPSVADATITATRGPAAVRSKQPEFPQRGADGGSGAAYLSRVDSQDDPEEGDSLSKFLGSLEQQMEEDVAGADALSDDGWTQLVAVVIATNSADACAQSIEALQVHIEDLLTLALERNPYLDCKLADKLAVTSIADLDRIAKAYADLRNSWVDQLTEMLSPAIDDLRVALRSRFSEGRNGHATKQSNSIGERAASSTVIFLAIRVPIAGREAVIFTETFFCLNFFLYHNRAICTSSRLPGHHRRRPHLNLGQILTKRAGHFPSYCEAPSLIVQRSIRFSIVFRRGASERCCNT